MKAPIVIPEVLLPYVFVESDGTIEFILTHEKVNEFNIMKYNVDGILTKFIEEIIMVELGIGKSKLGSTFKIG